MEKKPEVDVAWMDCDFSQLLKRKDDLSKVVCLAISCQRVELTGDDLDVFKEKFARVEAATSEEALGMTDEQRSYYIARRMLIG